MSRSQIAGGVLAAALAVVMLAMLVIRGDDDGSTDGTSDEPTAGASTTPPVVADETWCTGWTNLVALQAQYVATPTPEAAATLLAVVDDLQSLGVPESLDPAGHTELTAVLDDIRASVDPSFTPTVLPSEPADVAVEDEDHDEEGHGDEGDDHEDHGAGAEEAPFGAWLAEYCSV